MNTFNPGEFGKNLDKIANASAKRTAEDVAKLTGTEVPVATVTPPLTDAQKDANLNAAVNNLADHLEDIALKSAQASKTEEPVIASPAAKAPETMLDRVKMFIGTAKKF